MQRPIQALITLLFFIWLLPLGIFIKPSAEKIACDGQRAICLCHFHQAPTKKSSDSSTHPLWSQSTGSNKEANAKGDGSHPFQLSQIRQTVKTAQLNFFESSSQIPSLLLVSPIEHVPKF
jgi:hypothetical protein